VINATAGVYGLSGYVSAGCSEHQTSTGEWIGVLGVHRLLEQNPLPPEGSIIPSETTQPQITTPPQTTTPQTTTTTTTATTAAATTAATTAPFVSTTTVVEVVPSGGDTVEPVHNNNNHPHHVIPDPLKGIDELDEYGNDPHHEEQVPGLDSAVMVMIVSAFFLGILVSKYMQRNTNKLPKNTTGQGGTGKNGPGDLEKQSDDLSNEILNALSD
jgi:hypothetical protein